MLLSILLIALAASPSPSAHAEGNTSVPIVEIAPAPLTVTLESLVDHHMTPEVRTQFKNEMDDSGVSYAEVKDVRFSYDKAHSHLNVLGDPEKHSVNYMVFLGTHVGALFPFGLDGIAMITVDGRARWDMDASWEPSGYMQSYSLGAAFHPFHNAFFIGARVRDIQMHAPWSRGYDGKFDNLLGAGGEIGVRGRLFSSKFLGSISLGAFYATGDSTSLPVLYTLNVGLAYGVVGGGL